MTIFVDASVPVQSRDTGIILTNVSCETTVYVGAAVIMQASGIAKNALADDEATSNVIGIVISKTTSTLCNIRVLGVTPEIFTTLDVTKEYYLSDTTPGALVTSPPTASGHMMVPLGQPFSEKEFLVNKGRRVKRA